MRRPILFGRGLQLVWTLRQGFKKVGQLLNDPRTPPFCSVLKEGGCTGIKAVLAQAYTGVHGERRTLLTG